ncbi:hypothetical protein EI94DRAFT_1726744, partial [Lactarius quietus]
MHRAHTLHLQHVFQVPDSDEEKKRCIRKPTFAARRTRTRRHTSTYRAMVDNDYPIPSYLADVFRTRNQMARCRELLTSTVCMLPLRLQV